jgi:hypothetical protein
MLEGRQWWGREGASQGQLAAVRAIVPADLPEAYFQLLAWSHGGEGPLPDEPLWFVLDTVEDVIGAIRARSFEEFFPGFLVFASNGGGEAIAFDLRAGAPYPIVYFEMANSNLEESIRPLAGSFGELMALIGRL